MNNEIRGWVIARNARAEAVARIVVTQEANGYAIWYAHRSADPRLLTWYGHSPHYDATGTPAAALAHARRIADECIDKGAISAEARRFEQR